MPQTPEEIRSRRIVRLAARRNKLHAAGQCQSCRKPVNPSRSRWNCPECLDFVNQQYHARK